MIIVLVLGSATSAPASIYYYHDQLAQPLLTAIARELGPGSSLSCQPAQLCIPPLQRLRRRTNHKSPARKAITKIKEMV